MKIFVLGLALVLGSACTNVGNSVRKLQEKIPQGQGAQPQPSPSPDAPPPSDRNSLIDELRSQQFTLEVVNESETNKLLDRRTQRVLRKGKVAEFREIDSKANFCHLDAQNVNDRITKLRRGDKIEMTDIRVAGTILTVYSKDQRLALACSKKENPDETFRVKDLDEVLGEVLRIDFEP